MVGQKLPQTNEDATTSRNFCVRELNRAIPLPADTNRRLHFFPYEFRPCLDVNFF